MENAVEYYSFNLPWQPDHVNIFCQYFCQILTGSSICEVSPCMFKQH